MKQSITIKNKVDLLIYIFLGLSFITSQLSVALSSIGVVGVILLFTLKMALERKFLFEEHKLLYLFIAFLIWQIFTSVISDSPGSALFDTIKKASLYFVFFCSISCIKSTSLLKKYFIILFVFSALVSTYETIRYLIDFNAQDEFPLSNFRIRYFGYPITIGEIKMLILIVLVPFILARKNELLPKWSLILLSIPILISLYFTNTRNAMLGLFISLIVIGIVKHRYFLVGFVLAVSLFLYAAPMQVTERILSIADMNYPSNAVRFTMWETGLKMIKDKPVTGFGDVDILNIYTTYKKPELYGEGTHMHNNYMHITVLYGIPGLMIWLALMIYIFFRQIKIYNKVKSDNFLNVLALSSIASMIGFHVSGLTEWNFGDAEFVVVLWFVLSLTFITEKIFTGQKIE